MKLDIDANAAVEFGSTFSEFREVCNRLDYYRGLTSLPPQALVDEFNKLINKLVSHLPQIKIVEHHEYDVKVGDE